MWGGGSTEDAVFINALLLTIALLNKLTVDLKKQKKSFFQPKWAFTRSPQGEIDSDSPAFIGLSFKDGN